MARYEHIPATGMTRFDLDDGSALEFPTEAPGVVEAMQQMDAHSTAQADRAAIEAAVTGAPQPAPAHSAPPMGRIPAPVEDPAPAAPQRASGPLVNPFAQGAGGAPADDGGFVLPPAQPGRTVRIQGRGFIPQARTVEHGLDIPDDVRGRIDDARLSQDAVAENRLALAEQDIAAKQEAREREAMLQNAFEAKRRDRERIRQQRMKDMQAERDAAVEEIASADVDPGRFWEKKSLPQKVGSFLAAVLQGGLAARQGRSPQEALTQLMREQEQDVAEQQRKIHSGEQRVENMDTAYARMMERFQDEEMARQAALSAGLATIQRQLEQKIGETDDLRAQNDLLEARAAVQEQRANQDLEWAKLAQDRIVQREAFEGDRTVTVGGYDPLKELKRQAEGSKYLADIAENERTVRGEVPPEDLAKERQAYGKTLLDTGILEQRKNLGAIKGIVARNDGDVPGYGPVAGRVPDMVLSDDGSEMRRRVKMMSIAARKQAMGAATRDEAQEWAEAAALLESNNDREVLMGLKVFEERAQAAEEAVEIMHPRLHDYQGKRTGTINTQTDFKPK